MKNQVLVLGLLAAGLMGCATQSALPLGRYAQTGGPGVALGEATELRLFPDHRFEYRLWTDMVGVGQQGRGTYSLRGPQLRLRFDGGLTAPVPVVEQRPLPGPPASDSVAVLVVLRHEQEVAAGLTLLALDETGRILRGTSSNAAGRARLAVARTQRPYRFTVNGIGFVPVEQPWPRTSTAYAVHLAEKLGPAVPAGKALFFRILRQTPARLTLQQGSDTVVLAVSPHS